jgi:S-adenosylmethionine/arginine decarboxylase-like enzyme
MEGQSILISLNGADPLALSNEEIIKTYLIEAVKIIGLTPVENSMQIYSFPVLNSPQLSGITGGIILLESHAYLHSWPENGYIRIEFSSCKSLAGCKMDALLMYSKEVFKSEKEEYDVIGW